MLLEHCEVKINLTYVTVPGLDFIIPLHIWLGLLSFYSPVLHFVGCSEEINHFLPSSYKISECHSLTDNLRDFEYCKDFCKFL
jgi:hypothetical protein